MSEFRYDCSKCGGAMVKGYAADRAEHYFMKLAWVDGEPKQASLLGIKGHNIDVSREQRREVRGLRCEKCGFLELYAV
ncbi:MAG TPA: hypothetical protein PKA82_10435 [Pyrinomonadaceae bacterium]|nr:hypothetical protein [Pyrinomonadaceae bacterium]